MHKYLSKQAGAMLLAGVLAMAGCQGEKGAAGSAGGDGPQGPAGPAGPSGPGATLPPGAGLNYAITKAEMVGGKLTITFKATDAQGNPVDVVAQSAKPRFTLASVAADGKNTSVLANDVSGASYTLNGVSTAPAVVAPATVKQATYDSKGTFTATGVAGEFTYAFYAPVTTDPTTNYVVAAFGSRVFGGLSYSAATTFPFGPSSSVRQVVSDSACNACHGTLVAHGSRKTVALCATCHDAQTKDPETNNSVDFAYMAHKIHAGKELSKGYTIVGYNQTVADFAEVGFPQHLANCTVCHQGKDAANYKTKLSRAACGSCHDSIDFAAGTGHVKMTSDAGCTGCHDGTSAPTVEQAHAPVIPPNPGASFTAGGAAGRLNAAFVAAAGYVPPSADVLSYDVKKVYRTTDKHPALVFKLKRKAAGATTTTDVVFNTYQAGTVTDLITGFTGTATAYFAFAVPQDGIAKPADFNATASIAIKRVWNGSLTNGTLSGPDANGYYTITINDVIIPDTATMLTGGLGYDYSLPNGQPLTQIDGTAEFKAAYPYPWTDGTGTTRTGFGGLIVPIADKSIVGDGYTARRTIVATDKCNACHGFLGVAPLFHVGQRNDAPTCSFCHNPNKATGSASYGWSANAKDFVHAIHAAGKRQVDFTWESSAGADFWNVTYPNALNNCDACHVADTVNFGTAASAAATDRLLASTVAAGTYTSGTTSPYIALNTAYGSNFAFDKATGTSTDPTADTLVVSPITAACSACHDSPLELAHMQQNGGSFYERRDYALSSIETCVICHAKGATADAAQVHQ